MNKKDPSETAIPAWRKIASVFLGLILSLALLEAGFRLGGFVQLSLHEYGNLQSMKQKGAYRILCLGDSMTHMQYPRLLEQLLNQRNIGVRFSVIDKASGSANFSVILSRVESYSAEYHPDMVVTMMGTADKDFDPFQDMSENDTWIYRHCLLYRFVKMRFMRFLEKIKHENIHGLSGSHPGRKAKPESAGAVPARANLSNEAPAQKVALADLRRAMGTRGPTSSNLNGGRISKTEGSLKKAIELHPENDMAYVESGGLYKNQGKFSQAEDSYRKALEINPLNARAYIGLGRLYENQGKFFQAEESFKKAIEIYPRNDTAYAGLGELYMNSGKFSQAEDAFKKALELNPADGFILGELGSLYRDQGELAQAEAFIKKVIELNPRNSFALFELGKLYRNQRKFNEAEDTFSKALELDPKDEQMLRTMASLYEEMGKAELANEYAEKVHQVESGDTAARIVKSYHRLKEILDKKGIKLVCVQFPLRNVDPLKRIFANYKDVIFVDNERLFREAVKRSGYKEYFRDMFSGDYGHFTQKGNELLARNIADVILREVFNK
jgi:tetratricopeptide (TPR) repeat protein